MSAIDQVLSGEARGCRVNNQDKCCRPECRSSTHQVNHDYCIDCERARRARESLPFGLDRPEALLEPFCACGRVVSRCDGSRRGCRRGA
jgi:hypothetical protein